MSEDSSNQWKEKYLTALEKMESSEEKAQANQNLLRRAIVRVCLAADGLDPGLDKQLSALRAGLRDGQAIELLEPVVDRVEASVMALDDRRQQQNQQILDLIQSQIAAYQKLDLPRAQRNELKKFNKSLPDLVNSNLQSKLIEQISELYFQVNHHLLQVPESKSETRPSLISKLFGSIQAEENETYSLGDEPVIETPVEGFEADSIATDETAPQAPVIVGQDPFLRERVSRTLCSLLEHIDVPFEFSERKEKLVEKVKSEFQPEQLPEFLDETTQLVASIKIKAQKELEEFLVSLHQRLNEIQEFLTTARQGEKDALENQKKLDQDVRNELQAMRAKTEKNNNVEEIKQGIESMMVRIVAAVDEFQEMENIRRLSMNSQFETLAQRMAVMEAEATELKLSLETHRKQAMRDALTGLPNRAAYDAHIKSEFSRWRRHNRPLSIAIIDIDHFKRINDTLGHLRGDKVLRLVAREISKRVRNEDFVARYGGEEFVVIMPETDLQSAMVATEKVRAAIEACPFSYNQQPIPITASFGVTSFQAEDEIDTCFERADRALYRAKDRGRNRVEQG